MSSAHSDARHLSTGSERPGITDLRHTHGAQSRQCTEGKCTVWFVHCVRPWQLRRVEEGEFEWWAVGGEGGGGATEQRGVEEAVSEDELQHGHTLPLMHGMYLFCVPRLPLKQSVSRMLPLPLLNLHRL